MHFTFRIWLLASKQPSLPPWQDLPLDCGLTKPHNSRCSCPRWDDHVVVLLVVVVVLVVIRIVGDFTSVVPSCFFNAPSKTKAFVVFSILISSTKASINFSFCLFFPPGQTFGGWDLSLHSDPSWWKHHPLYNRVIMAVIKWRGWQPQWQVRPPSRNGNGASYAFVWLQGAGTERNPLQVITGTS